MKRREFILLPLTGVAWPLASRAQQAERIRRIGVLMTTGASDQEGQARVMAFLRKLRDLGWIEGHNLRVDYRWYEGDTTKAKSYATELARQNPDVILANGTPALTALKNETSTIAIVFAMVSDPLGQGLVSNEAHPGHNITGFTQFDYSIGEKWLEVLKEMAPAVARVAVIYNPDEFQSTGFLRAISSAAPPLGAELIPAAVRDAVGIQRAIDALMHEPKCGMLVITSPLTTVHRELIVTLAARHRLPAIYPNRFFAVIGGLVSYGADNIDLFLRAAAYCDRILKGERPGELPVQHPTKFELVINLNTAKNLGLTVPPELLASADEVIE
jgi:putative tryptophan/tyrosine transport system substrate-binding protein